MALYYIYIYIYFIAGNKALKQDVLPWPKIVQHSYKFARLDFNLKIKNFTALSRHINKKKAPVR